MRESFGGGSVTGRKGLVARSHLLILQGSESASSKPGAGKPIQISHMWQEATLEPPALLHGSHLRGKLVELGVTLRFSGEPSGCPNHSVCQLFSRVSAACLCRSSAFRVKTPNPLWNGGLRPENSRHTWKPDCQRWVWALGICHTGTQQRRWTFIRIIALRRLTVLWALRRKRRPFLSWM